MTANTAKYLAVDLGADSGRVIAGTFDGRRLEMEEVHRFANGGVAVNGRLYWDVLRLWSEIQAGIARAARQPGAEIASLGVDTWGVDFALLDRDDALVGNPVMYRDARTHGMLERATRTVPRAEIYACTGIQFMEINTLYQLYALACANSPQLEIAASLLMMPDLFNFWLSGQKRSEFTIATTSQCYNPVAGQWATALLEKLGLPARLFQPIIQPGQILDSLRPALAEQLGCPPVPVVAVGSHDTASAVAAVPARGVDFAYISSGTWSLIGVELERPLINADSLKHDFTNEGGVGGTIRFLKNMIGMWLLQECRREWARAGQEYSYDELTALAEQAPAFRSLIVPGEARFMDPGPMAARIRAFCRETGQPEPQTPGEIVRCILESLALAYHDVLSGMEELVGHRLPVIHIIGGGSRNRLLNQFTADATGCTVVAGPVEATAAGNMLMQAVALGHLRDLGEGRELVRRSFDVASFEPRSSLAWEDAFGRYLALKSR